MSGIDLARAEQTFAQATDGTVGLEEEFSVLDPATLDLLPRFEQLREAARSEDPPLQRPPEACGCGCVCARAQVRVSARRCV